MILIGMGLALIACFAICPLLFYRLRKANKNTLYASANPEYIRKYWPMQSTIERPSFGRSELTSELIADLIA